jgi:hypothetical protein
MKKVSLFIAALGIITIGFSSCSKNQCVNCQGIKVCEKDYTAVGGLTWSQYVDAAKLAGCTVE